ncbi:MAG TPA: aromatic ring-hydroxylating dioxygenase subunit alpha [Patescibacteria group bacterium]|nr:aromatic ring-hydroxylating dioxygenase subunit alpha [Patescibacteria group bacterium]
MNSPAEPGFDPRRASDELASVRAPLDEATTLPGRYYHDPAVLKEEMRRIFATMWLCIGRESDLARPGDFLTRSIGDESVLVTRDASGRLGAFYNVCRHRGSRLIDEPRGSGLSRIQCPYHAWSYELSGALRSAPHMDEVKGFDRQAYPLHRVRLETWSGFVFVTLAPEAPALETHLAEMAHYFDRYEMERLRSGRRIGYRIASNWKILCENYSECYHCVLVHPQLNRVSHYRSGEIDLVNAATVGGYMELRESEFNTMSTSGRTERRPFASITQDDLRRIHYYIIFPNLFLSLHPDYVMTHVLWPRDTGQTDIECEFLFDPAEMARPGFDASDAVGFWDETNKQDWSVCERAQLGTASASYDRGRLSRLEWMTHIFDNFIAERLTRV